MVASTLATTAAGTTLRSTEVTMPTPTPTRLVLLTTNGLVLAVARLLRLAVGKQPSYNSIISWYDIDVQI